MEIITPQPFESHSNDPPSKQADSGFVVQTYPAGFIRRAIAYLIDSAIIGGLYLFLLFAGLMGIRYSSGLDSVYFSGSGTVAMSAMAFLYTGYFTFFHSNGGQTPAKRILRIKVISGNGTELSLLHALIRTFGYLASFLFFGAGFLLTAIDGRKRALHDLLTYTQVVLTP